MGYATNKVGSVMVFGSAQGSLNYWDSTLGVFRDTIRTWACGTTTLVGVALNNTTDATSGTTSQYSPCLQLRANAWKTDATAASETHLWYLQARAYTGAAATTSSVNLLVNPIGAGVTSKYVFNSSGRLDVTSLLVSDNAQSNGCIFGAALNIGGVATSRGVYYYTADSPVYLLHSARTNGANNVCVHIGYWNTEASPNDYLCLSSIGRGTSTWTSVFNVYPKHVLLPSFAVAAAPATPPAGSFAYCTNGDAGSACLAVGNGSNWLRIALGAAISAT